MHSLKKKFMQLMKLIMCTSFEPILPLLREKKLTLTHIGALFHLYYKQSSPVSKISSIADISNAATSQMLDKLVNLGLVERNEDSKDRRIKNISITNAGRKFIDELIQLRKNWYQEIFESLSEEEIVETEKVISNLIEKIKKIDANNTVSDKSLFKGSTK